MIEIMPIRRNTLYNEVEDSILKFVLFGGSRITFVDEIFGAYKNGFFMGAISVSPLDEFACERPSIIGLLVLKKYRREGAGKKLLEKAILRMRERKLVPVHIDVLSVNALKLIETLAPELRKDLIVNDMSQFDCFETLEKNDIPFMAFRP